jgi:hypothetical protein
MPYSISTLSRCPPSGVQKECQRVIHFIAHNEVFQMQDLNDEQKKSKLFVLVHGDESGQDPNQLSLNSLFLSGKQQFTHAFEREIVNITDDDASTNELLVLKEVLHRQKNVRFVVSEECISERFLSSSTLKGRKKVEGRTIKNNSELAKKNALKCIAYAKIWMNNGGKNELPSGQSWDDMYEHVFSEMDQHLKRITIDADAGDLSNQQIKARGGGAGESTTTSSSTTSSGLFPGWMVFVLYGPYGPEPRFEINWIQESPNDETHKHGGSRKEARKKQAEEDKKERGKGIGCDAVRWGRGMTFDQKAAAVTIAQREDLDVRRQYENDILGLQISVHNLIQQKGQQLKLMEMKGGSSSQTFEDDLAELHELDQKIRKANEEIDDLKKDASGKRQKTNPMVRSLLESLGGGNGNSNVKNEFHITGEASLLSSVLHPPPLSSVLTKPSTTTGGRIGSSDVQAGGTVTGDELSLTTGAALLRRSPTAMSTLTEDNEDYVEQEEDDEEDDSSSHAGRHKKPT